MAEEITEWPKRPQLKTKKSLTSAKTQQLTVGRKPQRISRRKLLGLSAKAGLAAAALTALGRGSYETIVDVKEKVEAGFRAFRSLGRFFHHEPGAIQSEVAIQPKKEQQKPLSEFYEVFHNLPERELEKAKHLVRQMHGVISQNSEYQKGSLYQVTRKHEALIRKAAIEARINPNLAVGIVFVENGGGEAVRNQNSGAAGIAQLMPQTARRYNLQVDNMVDERADPQKSINAMGAYLKDLKLEFLDQGLATWAYHAGEGNVYAALRAYFKDTDGQDFGDVVKSGNPTIAEKYRRLIAERKLIVHQVLQNRQVQEEVLSQLGDETELYVYKVIAASQLFKINKEAFG